MSGQRRDLVRWNARLRYERAEAVSENVRTDAFAEPGANTRLLNPPLADVLPPVRPPIRGYENKVIRTAARRRNLLGKMP
jgi:hypothetical protein